MFSQSKIKEEQVTEIKEIKNKILSLSNELGCLTNSIKNMVNTHKEETDARQDKVTTPVQGDKTYKQDRQSWKRREGRNRGPLVCWNCNEIGFGHSRAK